METIIPQDRKEKGRGRRQGETDRQSERGGGREGESVRE